MSALKKKDFSLRMDAQTLRKLHYIAGREGRSVNNELNRIVIRRIKRFEQRYGVIATEDSEE